MPRTTSSTTAAAEPVIKGPASYFPSIERTYGRSIKEWKAMIAGCGLSKHMDIVKWLKTEHQMGHGHANALVAHTLSEHGSPGSSTTTKRQPKTASGSPDGLGSATFETVLSGSGNKAGIVIPRESIDRLGAGSRPSVVVNVNGYEYRSTVAVMGGEHMVGVSAAIRDETGLKAGDVIRVTLTVASAPREVAVPDDLQAAFTATPAAQLFFGGLANSLQRYHIDNINGAKTAETRQRRIDKTIALFLANKKR